MSEFHVVVARVTDVTKHPNADTLSIGKINGYPVIFKTGEFSEGSLAVHIPIDSICPTTVPEFDFLMEHRRVKARRFRGIFSMGFIIPVRSGWVEGQNVQLELGIIKYEPKMTFDDPLSQYIGKKKKKSWLKRWWEKFLFKWFSIIPANSSFDPGYMPEYTDIEGMRKYDNLFKEGENVIITEKIHGTNARFRWYKGKLWIGSHHRVRHDECAWSIIADQYDLKNKLKSYENYVFYGEIYGDVQDLKYGCKPGELKLAIFDICHIDEYEKRYLHWKVAEEICTRIELPTVPVLYRGPWNKDLKKLADGPTTIANGPHIREGIVVRPQFECHEDRIGRFILKFVGEKYLLRKGA